MMCPRLEVLGDVLESFIDSNWLRFIIQSRFMVTGRMDVDCGMRLYQAVSSRTGEIHQFFHAAVVHRGLMLCCEP
jgi:hypothetical protein